MFALLLLPWEPRPVTPVLPLSLPSRVSQALLATPKFLAEVGTPRVLKVLESQTGFQCLEIQLQSSLRSQRQEPLWTKSQTMMASSSQSHAHYPPKENSEAKDTARERQIYPRTFRVHDAQQMVWVLNGNSLTAVPASNNVKPVILSLIACRDTELQDVEKGNLVFLGIKSKNLCLFCEEIDGKPTLQLKDVDIMDVYNESKAPKAFLFYHGTEGSTSVFQSVSYPGWFIATSPTARQTVTLTQKRGEVNNTNFYLEPEN